MLQYNMRKETAQRDLEAEVLEKYDMVDALDLTGSILNTTFDHNY
jgi:hypothetical protein